MDVPRGEGRGARRDGCVGHCKKYHNILQIVVWAVLHVNLTFALSFVSDLHVQCGSVCRKFATLAYLRKRSTLVKICFITFVFSFVQEFGNERSELEGLIKQVKKQRRQERSTFRCHVDAIFKFKKGSLINCQDDTETSFFLRVVFYLFLYN